MLMIINQNKRDLDRRYWNICFRLSGKPAVNWILIVDTTTI